MVESVECLLGLILLWLWCLAELLRLGCQLSESRIGDGTRRDG